MNLIRAYVVDITYSFEERIVISLLCRREDNTLIRITDFYRPSFLLLLKKHTDTLSLRTKLSRLEFEPGSRVTSTDTASKYVSGKKEELVRVYTSRPETVAKVKDIVSKWDDVQGVFEDEISLTRKYLLENQLTPFQLFEAEVVDKKTHGTIPEYKLVTFKTKDILFMEPKVLSLTVEAEHNVPHSLAYVSDGLKEVVSTRPREGFIRVDGIRGLLEDFVHKVQTLKPDVILFPNPSFQLKDLFRLAKQYGVSFRINLDGSQPFISYSSRLRTIGSHEIFMERLLKHFATDYKKADARVYTGPSSSLLQKAEEQFLLFSSLLPNINEILSLLGLRPSDLFTFSLQKFIDWILIKESLQREILLLPTEKEHEEPAHAVSVLDTLSGVYDGVAHVDLSSLCTDIIIRENLSPELLFTEPSADAPPGLFSQFLGDIKSRISRIDQVLRQSPNQSLKRRKQILLLVVHGFHSALNYKRSQWYSADFVSLINKRMKSELLTLTSYITTKSTSVIYSDFKDLYIHVPEEGISLQKRIHEISPVYSWFEITTVHKRGLFLPKKEGRRKHYALYDSPSTIVFQNITRQNLPAMFKKFVHDLLLLLLKKESHDIVESTVQKQAKAIKEKSIGVHGFTFVTKLSSLEHDSFYPTLREQFNKRGINPESWQLVSYVVLKGPGPIQKRVSLVSPDSLVFIDTEYYLKRVYGPAVSEILKLKNISLEAILDPSGQQGLDQFMNWS